METYINVLKTGNVVNVEQTTLTSVKHEVKTTTTTKKSLTRTENKRLWIDNIRSVPFGFKGKSEEGKCTCFQKKEDCWCSDIDLIKTPGKK